MIVDYVIYCFIVILLGIMSYTDFKKKVVYVWQIQLLLVLIVLGIFLDRTTNSFVHITFLIAGIIIYLFLEQYYPDSQTGIFGTQTDWLIILALLTYLSDIQVKPIMGVYFGFHILVIGALYTSIHTFICKILKKKNEGIPFVPCIFICFVFTYLTQSFIGYHLF